jgi:serine/threonine protein kinase
VVASIHAGLTNVSDQYRLLAVDPPRAVGLRGIRAVTQTNGGLPLSQIKGEKRYPSPGANMPSANTAMNLLTPQEKEFLRLINTPAAQSSKPNTLFEKQDIVGKGAYGAVYKGKHRQTDQVVALKIINLDTADDDVEDIQKEVALLKRLMAQGNLMNEENGVNGKQKGKAGEEEVYGVPNVIKYYGCWTEGPKVWIVMELAEGGSVRTLVSGRRGRSFRALV